MGTLFLLPESKLLNTPSSLDGLSKEDEYDLRVLGCELIQSSGILLKLPQTAMATGQVLFHRFYYSKSFVRYPMEYTAMACVALASKIEEAPRRIRSVIQVFHNLEEIKANLPKTPLAINYKYSRLKEKVVKAERRILKELGFCVYVKHPHKFIVTLLQILENSENLKFVQTAWSYMNDSLRTDVFLRYSPETIACSCVYLSARVLGIPLPEDPAWWEIFLITKEDIKNVCKIILTLYTKKKPDQKKLMKTIDKLNDKTNSNSTSSKKDHEQLKCTLCTASYNSRTSFENHIKTAHNGSKKKGNENDTNSNNKKNKSVIVKPYESSKGTKA